MPGTYYVGRQITIAGGIDVVGYGVENTKIICNNSCSLTIMDGLKFF